MTPQAAMLFAAGFGTRMRPLTDATPKPLVSVAGVTLLDRALALSEGIGRRVVNAHYLADQIVDHLDGRDVLISVETDRILDTGGGLKHALGALCPDGPAPVFTLNTDPVWIGENPLAVLARAHEPEQEALLLLTPSTDGRGDFSMDSAGRLSRGGPLIYTGAQILHPGRVADWPEDVFSLNPVWDRIIEDGGAFGTVYDAQWCDVGTPAAVCHAEALFRGATGCPT